MKRQKKSHSKKETIIGISILLLLLVIAFGVYRQQFHFHPALLDAEEIEKGKLPDRSFSGKKNVLSKKSAKKKQDLSQFLPDSFTAMAAEETFSPDNLSDKINGKAELYLPAGFVQLRCRRFVSKKEKTVWMEAFVYDMANGRGAYTVYSSQRREGAMPAQLATFSYQTENALYFICGRYYVEIVAAVVDSNVQEAMNTWGKNFVTAIPKQDARMTELEIFPRKNMDRESIYLQATNAFGFEKFDNVFSATYMVEEEELTAYVSLRQNEQQAQFLADAFCSFLLNNGAVEQKSQSISGARIFELYDTYEIVFIAGKIIIGVHEAENRSEAEKLIGAMYKNIEENGYGK